MIVALHGTEAELLDGDDFKRFSLRCTGQRGSLPRHGPLGIELESDAVAWVPIGAVTALRGPQATEDWTRQLEAMVEKARPHGWIDDARGAIRAHVVWQDGAEQG